MGSIFFFFVYWLFNKTFYSEYNYFCDKKNRATNVVEKVTPQFLNGK